MQLFAETITSWPRWPDQMDEIGIIYPYARGGKQENVKFNSAFP